MKEIRLLNFIKKTMYWYFFLGLLIGIIMFINSFFNDDFAFNVINREIHGIKAGFAGLISMPLTMIIVGFFHVLFFYPIFKLLKKHGWL